MCNSLNRIISIFYYSINYTDYSSHQENLQKMVIFKRKYFEKGFFRHKTLRPINFYRWAAITIFAMLSLALQTFLSLPFNPFHPDCKTFVQNFLIQIFMFFMLPNSAFNLLVPYVCLEIESWNRKSLSQIHLIMTKPRACLSSENWFICNLKIKNTF